jgi:uncharacterized protein (DUF952 family)
VTLVQALFHIVDRTAWRAAMAIGHCSFAGQVAPVANARFRGVGNLCVVELDPARVGVVRVEDSYGEGTEFPHVYGPLPTAAAVALHELGLDWSGAWTFSADPGAGVASPDR